jgi:Holliday junction DNA helicase RuvA
MIAYLNGLIQKKLQTSLIIKVHGIGYEVYVNKTLLDESEENENIEVYIHTAVKEDNISLYGFKDLEELKMFKLLISVSGVGPKSALEILNNPISSIKYAIANEDSDFIIKTKGVGAKTAKRIIVDLKNKIDLIKKPKNYQNELEINIDAVNALINLGYKRGHINSILKSMPTEIQKTEEIIRYFLQNT